MRGFISRIAAAATVAAIAGAGAAAADYVILDSNAAGIEPGIVVDGAADISIPSGATVILLDPAGDTLVVEGPFTGRLTAAAAAGEEGIGDTLQRLGTSRGEDTRVLGVVRSPDVAGGEVVE